MVKGCAYKTKHLNPGLFVDSWHYNGPHEPLCHHYKSWRICSCAHKFTALDNLKILKKLLHWNRQHGFGAFVLPETLFPRAQDLYNGYTVSYASGHLRQIGTLVTKWKMRLIFFVPDVVSEYVGSLHAHEQVVLFRYLYYFADVLNGMRLDRNALIVLRLDKDDPAFLANCRDVLSTMPRRIRRRISFLCYNHEADRFIPFCESERIPLVISTWRISEISERTCRYVKQLWQSFHMRPIVFAFGEPMDNMEPSMGNPWKKCNPWRQWDIIFFQSIKDDERQKQLLLELSNKQSETYSMY